MQTPPPEQGDPSAFGGLSQRPMSLLQAPCSWHSSMASQLLGVPEHTPPGPHASLSVHPSPSSHASPVRSAHTPFEGAPFATEHAQHAPPSQAVSQQIPDTQKSLSQSSPMTHGVPSGVPGL